MTTLRTKPIAEPVGRSPSPRFQRLVDSPVEPEPALAPFVSIIVPVYNDAVSLRFLLSALAAQTYPANRFECVIVDNDCNSPVLLDRDYPFDVRLLREPQPGSYAARNRGVREARGEVLAFTDADCLPQPDWLTAAVARLHGVERPAMIAGEVVTVRQAETPAGPCYWYSLLNDFNQARFVAHFFFAATANMVTSRDTFEEVGEFDERLFSGGDREWGLRAWNKGAEQIFAPEVVVRHPARESWHALAAKSRRITGGHYQINSENGWPLLTTMALTLRIAWASFGRTCRDPRLPTHGCRLQVLGVSFLLRLVQLAEIVRLRCGGRPRRS